MSFERFFPKRTELKTAKTWMTAMQTREIQKRNYQTTGNLKDAREFATAAMQEVYAAPMQIEIPETRIEPIVIFSRDMLHPAAIAA